MKMTPGFIDRLPTTPQPTFGLLSFITGYFHIISIIDRKPLLQTLHSLTSHRSVHGSPERPTLLPRLKPPAEKQQLCLNNSYSFFFSRRNIEPRLRSVIEKLICTRQVLMYIGYWQPDYLTLSHNIPDLGPVRPATTWTIIDLGVNFPRRVEPMLKKPY